MRKEKSLAVTCHRFLCIFLLGVKRLTLDDAAAVLSGPDAATPGLLRTKIRRLYDIANVLVVLRLVGRSANSGKRVVFSWRGVDSMVLTPSDRCVSAVTYARWALLV